MKLAIALACLIASLSLATHSFADTTATLQQPVAKPTQFIVDHALWDCSGTTCVSSGVEEMYFGAQECHSVAKNAGVAVADFKTDNATHAEDRRTRQVQRRPRAEDLGRRPPTDRFFLACLSRLLGRSLRGPPALFSGAPAPRLSLGCECETRMLSGARLRTRGSSTTP